MIRKRVKGTSYVAPCCQEANELSREQTARSRQLNLSADGLPYLHRHPHSAQLKKDSPVSAGESDDGSA